jgi:four helix bundle protein
MNEEEFQLRTKNFALEAIRLARSLPENSTAAEIGKQWVNCATAVGAHYRAARRSRSRRETLTYLNLLATKAEECLYWIELLRESEFLPESDLNYLTLETHQILTLTAEALPRHSPDKLFPPSFWSGLNFPAKIKTGMTPLSTFFSFFPLLVMGIALAAFLFLCAQPGLFSLLLLLFSLYGFPLLVYRIHQYFYPVKEGISYLRRRQYSPWWGSHQIQIIYIAFPALESLLRLIPGAFSLWLRLWGAKVGRGIYWMPELEIADRGAIEIGDRAVIGHKVGIYSHIIKPKKQDLMLYVKTVKIGNDAFIGSASRLGPGVAISDGSYIPVTSDLFPNQKINPSA